MVQGSRTVVRWGPGREVPSLIEDPVWVVMVEVIVVPNDSPNDHLEHPGPYSCVYRLVDPDERVRRVIFVGESEAVDGAVTRLSGFVVDITEPMRRSAREAVAASVEHRASIEQAKGALMLTFGIGEGPAFDLLRAYSSHHNRKLAEVAERIVTGLADPHFSSDDPVRNLLDIVSGLQAPV